MRIADALLDEIRREGLSTVRMLERVPADKYDWRPHAKSMSVGELAFHIATIPHRAADLLRAGDFDLANARPAVKVRDDVVLVDEYNRNLDEFRSVVDSLDNEAIMQPFTLRRGDKVLLHMPKVGMIRTIGMNHSYHHRGQLSVYLRMLDVPLPAIYGTSADEI